MDKAIKNECFTGDIYIQTKAGPVEIEYVTPGVEVLSKNEITGELEYCKVVHQLVYPRKQIYEITIEEEVGYPELITVTGTHLFWVQGEAWLEVAKLKSNQNFETFDGKSIKIIKVVKSSFMTTVYNIEVERFHTYFVGGYGVWVHNNDGCGGSEGAKETVVDKKLTKPT